ncbi:MAG: hypothetical protein SGJ20_15655 [Planctomycetota bacterium]|nr:hypothetical protein [Planctomycetota bacterium]
MDFNRNQFIMAGVLFLLLGWQFRVVESFTLNEKTTNVLAKAMQETGSTDPGVSWAAAGPSAKKVVRHPPWLGFALMSIGSVLILHSLAMPKPGGS